MQHPDEGTIHAWLDGQLAIDEANEISSHLSDCPECAALVAEARGLVAASTRILTALDDVPAGVLPASPERQPTPVVGRRWYQRTDLRAAAALIFVAGGTLLVVRRGEQATFSPQAMTVAQQTGSGDTVATTSGKVESAPVADKLATSNAAVPAAPMRAHVQGPATASRASDAAVGIAERAGAPVLAPTPAPVNAAAKAASPPAIVGESNRLLGRRPTRALEALSSGTTNLAVADEIGAASLRVVRVDSSATTKQTVYEVTPGVQVTLAEVPVEPAMEKSLAGREPARRVAATMAPQRPPAESDQKPADSAAGRAGGAPRDAVGGAFGNPQTQSTARGRLNATTAASAMPAAAQPPVKTITWTANGRRYSLSGPLTEAQLERLKPLVMKLAAR